MCLISVYILLMRSEIVQNAERSYYNRDSATQHLDLSPGGETGATGGARGCEEDVWELVEDCWSRDEARRPTFSEINMFLKRKCVAANSSTRLPSQKQL